MQRSADQRPRWDLYCEVVDHFGDAGVLWRLARQLAADGQRCVWLRIDRPETLGVLVPDARPGRIVEGVRIERWPGPDDPEALPDVLITGFDCRPPPAIRARMRAGHPVWITLEHLTAERWVDRFHGSPSPKSDGCVEHFFYPGFSRSSGGLLFDSPAPPIRNRRGPARQSRRLLLFSYRPRPLGKLARACHLEADRPGGQPWELLLPAPAARRRSRSPCRGVTLTRIPFVPQSGFDALLDSCDLNFVRGEDSWLRALRAARPFIWQAWPQDRATRELKVEAWHERLAEWLDPAEVAALRHLSRWWNGLTDPPVEDLADDLAMIGAMSSSIRSHLSRWADHLAGHELTANLLRFAGDRAGRPL